MTPAGTKPPGWLCRACKAWLYCAHRRNSSCLVQLGLWIQYTWAPAQPCILAYYGLVYRFCTIIICLPSTALAGSWIGRYTKPHQPCRQSGTCESYCICRLSLTKQRDLAILAQQIWPFWTCRADPHCAKQEDLVLERQTQPFLAGKQPCWTHTPGSPIRQANPKVLEKTRSCHAVRHNCRRSTDRIKWLLGRQTWI